MQVMLNIDSANIGNTVEQVFSTLSDEDKKSLAKQVMLEVLQRPQAAERAAYEDQVIRELMEKNKSGYDSRNFTTPELTRQQYQFSERMRQFESSSERMMKMIVSATIENYKSLVTDLVKGDPQMQQLFETVKAQVVASFPQIIMASMAAHFSQQMGQVGYAINESYSVQNSMKHLAQNIQGQLAQQGVHVNL